ncbi:MAG: DUF1552 domain-containing protein [Acidimicrobiia bacterium]|nr:DUF1552 domain-containing protein [Acidimicrobiia bacterium]
MIVTKRHLRRRTFLRGSGVALALPLLDAMVPALTPVANTAAAPVRRIGFVYYPNGVIQEQWFPAAAGTAFEWTPSLGALSPHRSRLVVLSGLNHEPAEPGADSAHPVAQAAWLSAVHPITKGGVRLGTTADQIAARELGRFTPLPSLELALEAPSQIACDSGDCFFSSTISWRTPTTPNPMEGHPRVVFDRLFGDGGSADERRRLVRQDASILDSVTRELQRLDRTLGATDRTKLGEYVESVREIERRLQRIEAGNRQSPLALPDRPVDVPESFGEHAEVMFGLLALAFQADMTRVFTLLMGRESSNRTFPEIGVPDAHHNISHHNSRPDAIAKKAKIDTYHVQLLTSFLDTLAKAQDGEGSLLDHSLLLYGSGLGDGNLHGHDNVPAVLAGGCAGRLEGGRHVALRSGTPLANVYVTMLAMVDVPGAERFGDSTGPIAGL